MAPVPSPGPWRESANSGANSAEETDNLSKNFIHLCRGERERQQIGEPVHAAGVRMKPKPAPWSEGVVLPNIPTSKFGDRIAASVYIEMLGTRSAKNNLVPRQDVSITNKY